MSQDKPVNVIVIGDNGRISLLHVTDNGDETVIKKFFIEQPHEHTWSDRSGESFYVKEVPKKEV